MVNAEDAWKPTTAWDEAEILRLLPNDCSAKGALQGSKGIALENQKCVKCFFQEPHIERNDPEENVRRLNG